MKPIRTLLPTLVAIAGLAFAACPPVSAGPEDTPPDSSANIWQVFQHRRSVRKFKADPVPETDILKILDAARMAPTSGNQQPWKFLVVRDAAKIAAMKAACAERATRLFAPPPEKGEEARRQFQERMDKALSGYFSAPVYIVVLTDNTSKYPDYNHWDGPLAAANLMLAARALGYGTVFISDAIPDEVTRKVLDIPERYTRVCITPLGVPVEWPASPAKKPVEDFIAWDSL